MANPPPPTSTATHRSIRDAGHDEYWLQDILCANPKLLGLGDLELVGKERRHSSGGRLDILLRDPETEDMYEVEVMLGETDESHIIRTIEYWDIEKRRWPKRAHTAVLVAEKLNSRFQNVVNLLGSAIPIIGIQANLVELEGKTGLLFTKIIDSYEEPDLELPQEKSDEAAWKKKSAYILDVALKLKAMAEATYTTPVVVSFTGNYIAVGLGDLNRMWVRPRGKTNGYFEFRMNDAELDACVETLAAAGITPKREKGYLGMNIPVAALTQHSDTFLKIIGSLDSKNLTKKASS